MTHMVLSGSYQEGARAAGGAGLFQALASPELSWPLPWPLPELSMGNVTLNHSLPAWYRSYIKAIGIYIPAV